VILVCSSESLAACSSTGNDTPSSSASDLTRAHPANGTFQTVAGNSVAVDFALPGSGTPNVHACKPGQTELDIVYLDDKNFFARASTIGKSRPSPEGSWPDRRSDVKNG
jgi:hypothetical protein